MSISGPSYGNDNSSRKFTIAMVSDFFYPSVGGVENHIYMLSATLLKRGHKVVVITHNHQDRVGVRWLLPSLKVYYIPFQTIASSATLPEFLTFLPYLRYIALRERIDLIHGHGSLSSLAHEAVLHARLLGIHTVFTDHSLFGFDDAASILTNKLLEAMLSHVDAAICVSHTSRENTILRSRLGPRPLPSIGSSSEIESSSPENPPDDCEDSSFRRYGLAPDRIYVIPNAIVADQFKPSERLPAGNKVTVVVISRLAYRKGIDLLVATAPRICALFPNVRFLVGGDGPRLVDVLQMREKHRLQDRIELLGSVRPRDVRSILVQGSIFMNTSLTESFGIAILEAACAGLYVVSTRVGGIPEILPEDMISFANPDEDDVVRAMSEAIRLVSLNKHDPVQAHERVRSFYNWDSVAQRTEVVYNRVRNLPEIDLWSRLLHTLKLGRFAGPIFSFILLVDCVFFVFLEWWMPRQNIDYARTWDQSQFIKASREYTGQRSVKSRDKL